MYVYLCLSVFSVFMSVCLAYISSVSLSVDVFLSLCLPLSILLSLFVSVNQYDAFLCLHIYSSESDQFVCLSSSLPAFLLMYLSACPSVPLPVCMFVCLPVDFPLCLSFFLSMMIRVCPGIACTYSSIAHRIPRSIGDC